MSQTEVDGRNRRFWDELCGTSLATHLGITSDDPDSLKRFDASYFDIYPYLAQYAPAADLKGKKLLEIGLGYGTLGQYLAEQGCDYHGLDIAEGPVKMMRYRLGMRGVAHPESKVSQGSALEIPHADETFDFVYSIGCLHHTGNLQRSIDEVHRVLKPGGKAVIMLYNANSFRRIVKSPMAGAVTLFRSGPRGWVKTWREKERAMYDANAVGEAAPHTDYTSINDARTIFRNFEDLQIDKQNADPMLFPLYVPRKLLLKNLGRWLGLDLYITAVKPATTNSGRRSSAPAAAAA